MSIQPLSPATSDQSSNSQDNKQQELERNFTQQRKHYEKLLEQQRMDFENKVDQIVQSRLKESHVSDDDTVSDEPYVDEKRLEKKLNKFAQNFEKNVTEKIDKRAREIVEQRAQGDFLRANPDFHQIMNPDLIQKYAEKYPEMAEALSEMPDNFTRQKKLYHEIKALGLHKPPEAPKPSIQEQINNNRKSLYYQPTMSGAPPYAAAGDFSETGQKAAYAKMQEMLKNRKAF